MSQSNRLVGVQGYNDTEILGITAGKNHYLDINRDGTLCGWGYNGKYKELAK